MTTMIRLLLLALGALAAATLAGFAGAWGWLLDLCSHFRPQYAVAACLLAVLFLSFKRWRAGLAALAVMAVNLAAIVPLYLTADTPFAAPAQTSALRVMTANIYKANRHRHRIVEYIRREQPDVVVLLEVTRGWVKPLKPLDKLYPFRWVRPGDVFAGIAVYSRHLPVESRVFDLAGAGGAAFLVTVDMGDADRRAPVSILGAHLKSPTTPLYHRQRNLQLAQLARIAREHPWPLLVMGDLNATQFSPAFRRMLRDSGLRACAGQTLQPTWPVQFPPLWVSIDHCLASPGLHTAAFTVGPDVGSDHFPLMITARPAG